MANETEDAVNDNKGKEDAAAASEAKDKDIEKKMDVNDEYKSKTEKGEENTNIDKNEKKNEEKKDSNESKNISKEIKENKSDKEEAGEEKSDKEISKEKINEKQNEKESIQATNDTQESSKTNPKDNVDPIKDVADDKKKEEMKEKEEIKSNNDTNAKDAEEKHKDNSKDKTEDTKNIVDNDVKEEKNKEKAIDEKDSKDAKDEKKESLEEKKDIKESKKNEEKTKSKESEKVDSKDEKKDINEIKNEDQKTKDTNKDSDKTIKDTAKDSKKENTSKEDIKKGDENNDVKEVNVIKEDPKEKDIKKEKKKEEDIKIEDKKIDDKKKDASKNNDIKKEDLKTEGTKNEDTKSQDTTKDVKKDAKKEDPSNKDKNTEEVVNEAKEEDTNAESTKNEDTKSQDSPKDVKKDDKKENSNNKDKNTEEVVKEAKKEDTNVESTKKEDTKSQDTPKDVKKDDKKEDSSNKDKKAEESVKEVKEDLKKSDTKEENKDETDIKTEDKKLDDKEKDDTKTEKTKTDDPKSQDIAKDINTDVNKEDTNTKDTNIEDVNKVDKIKSDEKIDAAKADPKKESEKRDEKQKDTKTENKKEDSNEGLSDKVENIRPKSEIIVKDVTFGDKDKIGDSTEDGINEDKAPLLGKVDKVKIESEKKSTKPNNKEEKKIEKKQSNKEIDDDKKPLIENEDNNTAEKVSVLPKKEESRSQATAAPSEKEKVEEKSQIANGDKKPVGDVDVEAACTKESKSETSASGNVVVNPMPVPKDEPQGEEASLQGLNARLGFAIAAAALGSAFQHGFNLGVINAPLNLMGNWLNQTNYNRNEEYLDKTGETMIISLVVSIYCVGGMVGGAATGFFSERFGRKGALLINNVFAIIAAVLFGFCKMADSWEMIVAGRFFIGINNGLNAGLCPMYLSEIAPTSLRGSIGTVYQLVVTISILFSQIMGLENILGTSDLWPILLSLTALPAIFQLVTLPICPESPKFLLIVKEEQVAAQRALTWLRDSSNVHEEMEEMRSEAEAGKLVPTVSLREILTNPTLKIPLLISVMMMLAQQLSGINAVIFFSSKIYASAGLSQSAAINATIAMGSMNVLMTVISLVMVEKAGRKTLMLIGMVGMMIVCILLTLCLLFKDSATWISYLSIVLVILFVVMFATGPGSIPWFLVTEVFAQNARPMASSIAVAVNWTAAFIVGLGFLPIAEALGPYVFIIFVAILAFFIVFTWFKVPETKGKNIDEITAMFKQQAYGGNSV